MRKDKFTREQRSRLMARIKSKETNFENRVFAELQKRGLRFKTHYAEVVGKPDIAQPRLKRAIFLHSDFWHGWRLPAWEHILPNAFWKEKLRRNRVRDRYVIKTLRKNGWRVLVVWQHQIRRNREQVLKSIVKVLRD